MSEDHPLEPTTVHGASKLAGELDALAYWRTYGLPVSVIRPFNTYGPREPYAGARAEVIPRFALQLDAGRPPVVYGNGTRPAISPTWPTPPTESSPPRHATIW